jgi:O-antigen/teichoic acid export membrane protein
MLREISKKVSIYSLVPLINRGGSFLLLPIYTRVLTPADYGVMELLDVTSNIIGLIFGTRVGQALFYFYFAARNEEERETCMSSLYAAAGFIGVLCGCTMFASGPLSRLVFGNSGYIGYFNLVFASFAVSVVGELNLCYLRAMGRAGRYVLATAVTVFLNILIGGTLLLVFHLGVKGVLWAGLISSALTMGWLAGSCLSRIRIQIDLRLVVRMFRYSVPLSVSGLAMLVVHYGDRIFLRSHVTLAELGLYGLAYKVAMLVPYCHLPFFLHWNAQVRAILDRGEGRLVYTRICTYVTAGLAVVGVAIALFTRPVMVVMVGRRFFDAAAFVPVLAGAYVIRAVGAHIQGIFVAEGTPGLEARVSLVGAGVCLGGYALLIPPFKVWGAVLATLFGFVAIFASGLYYAQRLRHFDFEYGRLLRISGAACLIVAICHAIPFHHLWTETASAFGFLAGYLVWIFFGCLHSGERRDFLAAAKHAFRRAEFRDAAQASA